jgi:hypothetical protein
MRRVGAGKRLGMPIQQRRQRPGRGFGPRREYEPPVGLAAATGMSMADPDTLERAEQGGMSMASDGEGSDAVKQMEQLLGLDNADKAEAPEEMTMADPEYAEQGGMSMAEAPAAEEADPGKNTPSWWPKEMAEIWDMVPSNVRELLGALR